MKTHYPYDNFTLIFLEAAAAARRPPLATQLQVQFPGTDKSRLFNDLGELYTVYSSPYIYMLIRKLLKKFNLYKSIEIGE